MRPPILILGSHRSGTSATAYALRTLGLFLGNPHRCDQNAESFFFLRGHDNYLAKVGASWHQPEPLLEQLACDTGKHQCQEYLHWLIDGRFGGAQSLYRRFAGFPYAIPLALGSAWGWKDPRTTLFAPVWLEIFPHAKVLHVVRHPLDAALSLQARQFKFKQEENYPWQAPRLEDLNEAFALVQLYVEYAVKLAHLNERYCEVRFEDLQAHPIETLEKLAEFCALRPRRDQLQGAAAQINREPQTRRSQVSQFDATRLMAQYSFAAHFGY